MEQRSLHGSLTEQNLLKAFAGESQARNRYTYYASQARKEGYELIANFFQETANNEEEHGKQFFSFLEGGMVEFTASYPAGIIGTTEQNLLLAAEGEYDEWSDLYPEYASVAEDEGFLKVAAKFKMIVEIEKHHERRFRKLLEVLSAGEMFSRGTEQPWFCLKCGHVHMGNNAPEVCPVCLHPKAQFADLLDVF